MQPKSEQSVSPAVKETVIVAPVVCEECGEKVRTSLSTVPVVCPEQDARSGTAISRTRLKELLSKSLAVLLTTVVVDSSPQTAEKILNVLRDEFFDIDYFRHVVTDLKKCEEITKSVYDKKQ